MSFPRYPEYKGSGVEWLGEVPRHWQVQPCRAICIEQTEKNEGIKSDNYLSLMANVGVILYEEKGDVGNKKPEDLSKCKLVDMGDLVINSMNYGIGSYGISPYKGVCSPVYIVLTPKDDVVDSQFAFRLLEVKGFQTFSQSFGNGILEHRAAINWDILKSIGVPVPPLAEQKAIVAFLEKGIAEIDGLIAEQEKLIALLKEKRQAVISHAVTKGLDPSVPMKDSGIDWFGEVPAHWEVRRLKHVSPNITVGIVVEPSKYYCDEGVPALRSLNVKPGKVELGNMVFISREANELHSKSKLQKGDLIAVRSGQPGVTAVVPAELDGCNCIDLIIIRKPTDGDERFLCWYLASDVAVRQFSEGSGGAIQQHFNIGTAVDLMVAVPPVSEQRDIACWLSEKTSEIDKLIVEAERGIDLLGERRSALISAAVTGKIDVRKLAAAEAS